MRENNRKPIEKCRRKLPQFTTMNVIDGQAGLVIYSSLIFYSLTIDNILNIIVLLILAGVTIATLTGGNGILTRATEAKNKTEEAQEKEGVEIAVISALGKESGYQDLNQIDLQKEIDNQFGKGKATVTDNGDDSFTVSFIESKRDYNITSKGVEKGINWDEAMEKAKAPISQDEERNNGYIGIGTDGNPVDLDNWNYILYNGTYALNILETIEGNGEVSTAGYIGTINSEGKITGMVPAYIKGPEDDNFIPVTNLRGTFYNLSNLKIAPKLPASTEILRGTFSNCTGLIEAPSIPQNVKNMRLAFYKCTSLKTAPNIPYGVQDMRAAFSECTNLITPCENIPSTVISMIATFQGCSKLQGTIRIDANLTGAVDSEDPDQFDYSGCFWETATDSSGLKITGTCPKIPELISTKSASSNITN